MLADELHFRSKHQPNKIFFTSKNTVLNFIFEINYSIKKLKFKSDLIKN